MIRAGILTIALLALPGVASAHCGSTQGSFAVSCESGVKVYRQNAPSPLAAGPTSAQAQLQIAKLRQQTAQQRIAADRAGQSEQAELRRQEVENERYRNRIEAQRRLRSDRGYGYNGYYGGGYRLARPVTVRSIH